MSTLSSQVKSSHKAMSSQVKSSHKFVKSSRVISYCIKPILIDNAPLSSAPIAFAYMGERGADCTLYYSL